MTSNRSVYVPKRFINYIFIIKYRLIQKLFYIQQMSYRPRGPPPYRYDGGPPFGGYPAHAGLFGPPGYVHISSLILLLDMTLSG
jgi:hypothetical protein